MKAIRAGFTLVEVLLAAAVGGTLMFGLFGALDLSARYRTAGRDQAQCDRLASAVARYLEKTIREAPLYSPGDADSALAPEVARRAIRPKTSTEPDSDAVLISGDATTLVVGVRDAPAAHSLRRTGRAARILSTESLRTEQLPGRWGARTVSGHELSQHPAGKLATAVLREVEPASALSRSRWEVESLHDLSEDVVRLSFRYFDGRDWAGAWDGDEHKQLQAVEVSFVARSGSVERPVQLVIPTLARGGRR